MNGIDRAHDAILQALRSRLFSPVDARKCPMDHAQAVEIYRAQCLSRALDRQARKMQAEGQGFYTIGSSGHEGMASVAAALRTDDMAFLHYRDGAFQTMRSAMAGVDAARDMLLSFASSSDDPISGGRHKVLGSKTLNIPPQTSTIASHLPKAMGAAYSIHLAKTQRPEHQVLADDGIVFCSFGDASANHSTALGAINAACWASYQNIPMPIIFACEDNGIGISTPTPDGWIAANFSTRPKLKYFYAEGCDLFDSYNTAQDAANYVRQTRKPAFLHLRMVRLGGHAGSDVEEAYLPRAKIAENEARDPLLQSARLLIETGVLTNPQALEIYEEAAEKCENIAREVVTRPRLSTAKEVMASIIPPKRHNKSAEPISDEQREEAFGAEWKQLILGQPLSRLLNWTLTDLMLEHNEIVMMGEDIGQKGGVYGVTGKLAARFGRARVIDTLLDEQSILGLAIGTAHNGFVPIPEIQFLAYLHNAEDQIRGEAATLPFFSNGQFGNPMVVRIAGLGLQRGFGGHFHNDNSLGVLRDIPGLIVACPSKGDDAALMLREAVRLAREEGRIVAFIEPIALYNMRDFVETGDSGWLANYPEPQKRAQFGEVGVEGDGALAIISYGNGRYLSSQAAHDLAKMGIDVRVIDLRWLAPLPKESLLKAINQAKAVLIVDECRESGNVSEGVMSFLAESQTLPFSRIAALDSFIATGPAYAATIPSREDIVNAARSIWQQVAKIG